MSNGDSTNAKAAGQDAGASKKMKKTDIGVVAVMYLICGCFYAMTTKLEKESQTYPLFTIVLLFALTTLYVVTMFVNARKYGVEKKDNTFDGFVARQFFVIFAAVVLYLLLIYVLGFFLSTIVFLFAVLFFMKVSLVKILIVEVSVNLLVYLAFVLFLGVKLPGGLLF